MRPQPPGIEPTAGSCRPLQDGRSAYPIRPATRSDRLHRESAPRCRGAPPSPWSLCVGLIWQAIWQLISGGLQVVVHMYSPRVHRVTGHRARDVHANLTEWDSGGPALKRAATALHTQDPNTDHSALISTSRHGIAHASRSPYTRGRPLTRSLTRWIQQYTLRSCDRRVPVVALPTSHRLRSGSACDGGIV